MMLNTPVPTVPNPKIAIFKSIHPRNMFIYNKHLFFYGEQIIMIVTKKQGVISNGKKIC